MSDKIVEIGGVEFDFDNKGNPTIWHGAGVESPNLNELGKISEWLAVAWGNVAGEAYKPVVVSERGHVYDEGRVAFKDKGDGVILPGERYPAIPVERDCE